MWKGADYEIIDPRPIAAAAPYTYFLPAADDMSAVKAGDFIKAIVRGVPSSQQWHAERLWFSVVEVSEDAFDACLDNDPSDMPIFERGRMIRIPRAAVIGLVFADGRPTKSGPREYWDGCLVDISVLKIGRAIDYIYRERPDPARKRPFPDSGWRIRAVAGDPGDRSAEYTALGKVLNRDDSWLPLIDSPVGSAFLRESEGGPWIAEAAD